MSASSSAGSLRVYIHSAVSSDYPEWVPHTLVFVSASGEASARVRQMKTAFKEEFLRKYFSKEVAKLPIMTAGVFKTADGRELKDEELVASVLEDREDVFLHLIKPKPAATTTTDKPKATTSSSSSSSSSSSTPTTSSSSAASPTIQLQTGSGPAMTINRADLGKMGAKEQIMFQQLSMARELQSNGQLRKARDIYLQILATLPSNDKNEIELMQSARQICHQQLGVIFLYNRFYDQACPHFEGAIKIVSASANVIKNLGKVPQPDLAQLISLAGQCYFGLKDYLEAQTHFERALKLLQPKGDNSKDAKLLASIDDTKVWLARSLYRGSPADRNQALQMFEGIIQHNEHHIAALTYYAQIAVECGRKGEVIPYVLRALVASQALGPQPPKGAASYEAAIHMQGKNKRPENAPDIDPQLLELVQTLLTDLVCLPGGVKMLLNELHTASDNYAALTFLAQTVKDQGGVTASIELYKRALTVANVDARGKSNLLLNLVHTMELNYLYQEAFDLIKDYMRTNKDLTCGSLQVSKFYDAIANINNVFDVNLRTGEAKDVPAYCEMVKLFDEGVCHITIPQAAGGPPPKKSTAVPYPSDDLNIMALMFTAVKMLYVCGGLQVIPVLVNMLEPLRVDRDLHLTQIRNEHAYFSSIAQMMRYISFPIPAEFANPKADDIVYVMGDSHSMSSAWQVVKLDSHPRPVLLQPKLVTGLKCWHMRPSCRFYPKRNFEAALKTIPQNSHVIFNFGEIDCREGLLVAVEKGRYPSIDDGIKLAIDVYVKVMQEQSAINKWKVYVHPITPVLDVTRPTVKKFCSALKSRVNGTLNNAKPDTPALLWLDFFEQLLTPDGQNFNMDFHLDSTHLKPTYAQQLLKPALNKVFPGGPAQIAAAKVAAANPSASISASSSSSASVAAAPAAAVSEMSTLDAINARLAQAQMNGGFPAEDEIDVNGMD